MQVTVHLQGHLREFFPQYRQPVDLAVDGPVTVAEVLARMGIAAELPASVLVGGVRVDREYRLADGDTLLVLSPLAGG